MATGGRAGTRDAQRRALPGRKIRLTRAASPQETRSGSSCRGNGGARRSLNGSSRSVFVPSGGPVCSTNGPIKHNRGFSDPWEPNDRLSEWPHATRDKPFKAPKPKIRQNHHRTGTWTHRCIRFRPGPSGPDRSPAARKRGEGAGIERRAPARLRFRIRFGNSAREAWHPAPDYRAPAPGRCVSGGTVNRPGQFSRRVTQACAAGIGSSRRRCARGNPVMEEMKEREDRWCEDRRRAARKKNGPEGPLSGQRKSLATATIASVAADPTTKRYQRFSVLILAVSASSFAISARILSSESFCSVSVIFVSILISFQYRSMTVPGQRQRLPRAVTGICTRQVKNRRRRLASGAPCATRRP